MNDLRSRFDFAALMILSAWEFESDGETTVRDLTDSEGAHLEVFERLRDTVDAIPASLIKAAEERYAALGPEKFEQVMIANVQAIVCQTLPKTRPNFSNYSALACVCAPQR